MVMGNLLHIRCPVKKKKKNFLYVGENFSFDDVYIKLFFFYRTVNKAG